MTARKLPIGLQTFSEIIEQGYAYVDKTAHAWAMVSQGKSYFLSRPRRFGKSLFLDTLKELFEGSEALFRGLYIHERWDWSRRHPVIRFDFSVGVLRNRDELDQRIDWLLRDNARRLGLTETECGADIPGHFAELIQAARAATGQSVVILVDEYDKPILDNITDPTGAGAEIREGLKNLYSVMKGHDADIRFVFMTGVTKFSKVSLFSGLNQLEDLTLDERFATLCGYTQSDLETTFGEHLRGADWARLKQWYNGYSFLGEPVYNPFDILLFIAKGQRFRPYWFETGNPSFLIELLRTRRTFLPSLEAIEASEEILDSFDIERIDPVTLLFQTGYLTIDSTRWRRSRLLYRLRLPNQEVKMALADHLIDAYLGTLASGRDARQDALYECLIQGDLDGLIETLRRLFAGIPWRNFTGNALPESEGYYASVLYAFFASLNAEIIPEDISNQGQVDLTIKLEGYIYVIEIKVRRGSGAANGLDSDDGAGHSNPETPTKSKRRRSGKTDAEQSKESANPALAQIRARDYSAKYRSLPNKGLFELGLVFDSQARNLAQADWRAV